MNCHQDIVNYIATQKLNLTETVTARTKKDTKHKTITYKDSFTTFMFEAKKLNKPLFLYNAYELRTGSFVPCLSLFKFFN